MWSTFICLGGGRKKKVLELYVTHKWKAWFLTAETKLALNGVNFTFIYSVSLSGI